MGMVGRQQFSTNSYRFGFNGKENDNEVKGLRNQQDYGFRVYDPRLGRFLSVDPLTHNYAMLTPYQFASNTPLIAIDLDGKEKLEAFFLLDKSASGEVVTSGATVVQVTFDVKTQTIRALYGKVDGLALRVSYNIETKGFAVEAGNVSTDDIVEAYGQVGTKLTKGQIRKFISLHDFLKNIGLSEDLGGFENALADFDTKSWESLKEHGLEDLHISGRTLLDDFLDSELRLQVFEKGENDVYRVFDNEPKNLSEIENGLKLKLALLQVEIPPTNEPKQEVQTKPAELIDKRPTTDHPEDSKWKRDAYKRAELQKPVEQKKKQN